MYPLVHRGRSLSGWLLALCLALLWLAARPAWADDGPLTVSLAEYRDRLDRAAAALAGLGTADALVQARAELAPVTAVTLPSGATVRIKPFLAADTSAADARGRLRLLRAQLAAAERDDAATRLAVLERVLARPEFAVETFWARALRRLRELLARLLPWRTPAPASAPALDTLGRVLVWLIALAGGVAIALLLGYWLQGLLRSFVADAEIRRRATAGDGAPLTAAAARRRAVELAGAGDYRAAVRQFYNAMLLTLVERGLVRRDRSLTNRELLARLPISSVRETLTPVVDTFEAVWYGVRQPDAAAFGRYREAVDAVGAAIEESARPVTAAEGEERR
jgi:hypothetical protein